MSAQQYNMTFYAGDTEHLRLQYKDADGNVIRLASGLVQIKHTLYDTAPLVTCVALIDETNTANFKFTKEMTTALCPLRKTTEKYVYDAQLTTANGDVKTVVNGTVTVLRNVTGTVAVQHPQTRTSRRRTR